MLDTIDITRLLLSIREAQRRAEANMDGERMGRVSIPELSVILECMIVNRTQNDPPSPMWIIDADEKGSTLIRRYHEDSILRALEAYSKNQSVPEEDDESENTA